MKKSETLERTHNAKVKYVSTYFKHFKDGDAIIETLMGIMRSFDTCVQFKAYIQGNYPVTPCGKNTTLYWLERGYDMDSAAENTKPYKVIRDASKSPMNKQYWLNKGYTDADAVYKIKSQRKLNAEYWLSRGYTQSDAVAAVTAFQVEQSRSSSFKRRNNPDKYILSNSLTPEYWVNKGYSLEESKSIISERQSTFSKDKCILRHGKESGIIKWQERQDKWQDTLKNKSLYDGHSGKSVSVRYKIDNYDLHRLANSISFRNKHEIYDVITSCDTIEEVLNRYVDIIKTEDDITFYKAMRPIMNSTFFKLYYGTTREHILSIIIPKLSFIRTIYGNIRWYNNHICRSDCEYRIAKILVRNGIDYVYEKPYGIPGKRIRCDFYLPKFDVYIEYNGMSEKNYDKKKTILRENDIINVYHSVEVKDIQEFILKLKHETKD